MKHYRKLISCLAAFALVLCGLTACIDGDVAKGTIESFLAAVAAEDFETASALLHPEWPADLAQFFNAVEEENSVDFQSGIENLRYSGFQSAHYDSTVGGSTYLTTAIATVGDMEISITVEIVENDAGYGIYNFEIDF